MIDWRKDAHYDVTFNVFTSLLSETNRCDVAVRLLSNRSQMTLKCGKSKKVAQESLGECVIDVLTTYILTFSEICY